jgi:hypothetical protein
MFKILVVLLAAIIFGIVAYALQSKNTPSSKKDVEPTTPEEKFPTRGRKPSPHSGVSATLTHFKKKREDDLG